MNKLASLGVGFQTTGMTVCPTVTNTHNEIGSQERSIAVTVMCLYTDHTGIEIVLIRNRTPAHQRRNNRHTQDFSQFDQQWGSIRQNNTAARNNQRFFGIIQHAQSFFNLCTGCSWLGDFQRSICIRIEFDFTHLDVQRKINQARALAAGTHQIKCFLQSPRNQCRFTNRYGHFGNRCSDFFDINSLEIFLEELCTRSLPGNSQNRSGIGNGGIKPGNHIGCRRTGSTDADTDIALFGTCITFSHMSDALAVTCQNMLHGAMLFQCRIKRIDTGTGDTEQLGNTFFFQYIDSRFGCGHFCHEAPPG